MQLSNSIFSNHKNESNLDRETSAIIEGLNYLNQRVSTLSEKKQSADFSAATNCLNSMKSDIRDTVTCNSTPALNHS